MGITNLLTFLKPLTEDSHLSQFQKETIGIDGMVWLHKCAFSCAYECMIGQPVQPRFGQALNSRLKTLLNYQIRPVMVLDGKELPAKKQENENRRKKRENAKAEALALLKVLPKPSSDPEFISKCQQCISITPEMIDILYTVCNNLSIEVIAAPFEADAQLSYLCRIGYIDAVISEDSDLLAYGCPRVLYKLDHGGRVDVINLNYYCDLEIKKQQKKEEITKNTTLSSYLNRKATPPLLETDHDLHKIKDFSRDMFIGMCILSGCDYCCSFHIKGMGIKTAFKLIASCRSFEAALQNLILDSRWRKRIPDVDAFLHEARSAYSIFFHHDVVDPFTQEIIPISASYLSKPSENLSLPSNFDASLVSTVSNAKDHLCAKNESQTTSTLEIKENQVVSHSTTSQPNPILNHSAAPSIVKVKARHCSPDKLSTSSKIAVQKQTTLHSLYGKIKGDQTKSKRPASLLDLCQRKAVCGSPSKISHTNKILKPTKNNDFIHSQNQLADSDSLSLNSLSTPSFNPLLTESSKSETGTNTTTAARVMLDLDALRYKPSKKNEIKLYNMASK